LVDSGSYKVTELSNEFQVSKTINDREIIYGYLTLEAEIMETPKLNTFEAVDEINAEINGINIIQK
jgi:hypothetical protein